MRALTLEHVAEVLLEHDLITQDHLRTIMVRENQLVAMARKAKERIWGKDSRPGAALVTPVEIVVQAQIPHLDGSLGEDAIMEALAMASGMPFYKIDPLRLDAKLITRTLSRGFARSNTILPLWQKDGVLTIAVDNPYNRDPIESLRSLTGLEVDAVLSSKSGHAQHVHNTYST